LNYCRILCQKTLLYSILHRCTNQFLLQYRSECNLKLTLQCSFTYFENRFSKKWRWVGALLVNTGDTCAKRLSAVSVTDLTPTPPNRLSFDILLSTVESIKITRMLKIADLDTVLLACRPSWQLAKLGAENAFDKITLDRLASFMDKQQQVFLLLVNLLDLTH